MALSNFERWSNPFCRGRSLHARRVRCCAKAIVSYQVVNASLSRRTAPARCRSFGGKGERESTRRPHYPQPDGRTGAAESEKA